MDMIGQVKLPIQDVVKVEGDDIEILDYIFDMKVPDMTKLLELFFKQDIPSMAVIKVGYLGFIALFFYRPPDIWLDFDHQKYQLYLSPNLPLLIHYWTVKRMKTHDLFESQLITKVIAYLEDNLTKAPHPSVSHT